ncbi:MAG: lectin like domain-containing protein, partial [Clostridia bacterium]|nr:lectin like domain-containing protein [Clostridia bacterium]
MKRNWKRILACFLVSVMMLNSFTSYAGELDLTAEEKVEEAVVDEVAENLIEDVIVKDDSIDEYDAVIEEIIEDEETVDDDVIGKEDNADDRGDFEGEEIIEDIEPEDATDSEAEFDHVIDYDHVDNGLINIDYEPDDVLPSENTKKAALPSKYESPYATSVKNQRSYGTCWSFASNGAAEASMKKQGLIDKPNFSEWALAYFIFHNPSSWPNAVQELSGDDYSYLPGSYDNSWWNNGGNQLWAAMFFSAWRGVANESQAVYPYSTGDGSGEVESKKTSPYVPDDDACNNISAKLVNARFLPYGSSTNYDLIKRYITEYGSIAVSYYQSSLTKKTLNGETYWEVDSYKNQTTSNHSVLCIGWDDDKKAWLIKGSYGSTYSYSNNGYYWLPYDNPSIDDWTAMQFTSPDAYDFNYHYDGDCIFTTQSLDDKSQIGNIYPVLGTANTYQQIEAVNVGIQTSNTNFTVDIYTSDTKMAKPTDGTKAAGTASGTTDASGLYTVKLSTPVRVKVGTYFSVVVTLDFPGTADGQVFVDQTYSYSNHVYKNTAVAGESMDYEPSYGNWYDGTKYSRPLTYRIKAFTNKLNNG